MNYEKIRQEKITGINNVCQGFFTCLAPRQNPGCSLRTVFTDDLGCNPLIRDPLKTYYLASLTLMFVGLTEYFRSVLPSTSPVSHQSGSQLSPFIIYSQLDNTCETRTNLPTLLFSYRDVISQMMELFNMKENTKKILIFYRAIILNVSFQIAVRTNLEEKFINLALSGVLFFFKKT